MAAAKTAKPVSAYISTFDRAATKITNQSAVCSFLSHALEVDRYAFAPKGKNGKPIMNKPVDLAPWDALGAKYLKDAERDHALDVLTWIAGMKGRHVPPKSISSYKGCVLNWFVLNRVKLEDDQKQMIKAKTRRAKTATKDIPLTRDILRRMFANSMPLHMKAFFLTLISTGARDGEVLDLTLADVDLDAVPATVHIKTGWQGDAWRDTKSGEGRIAYLTGEAVEVLREWKAQRPGYLARMEKLAAGRMKACKNMQGRQYRDDDRLFPISMSVLRDDLDAVVQAVYKDIPRSDQTNRRRITFHGTRRFFRTQLPRGGENGLDVTEYLMGHEGYLTDPYRRVEQDQAAAYFAKNESLLWIEKEQPINAVELKTLDEKIQTKDQEIAGLKAQVTAMQDQQATIFKLLAFIKDKEDVITEFKNKNIQ